MPSDFWEIEDDLENCDFSSPGQYELFPSREVFARGPAGTACLTQPASSLVAGSFGGEMEQAMEMKKLFPFPCLLLGTGHLPFSCCTHWRKEHKTSVSKAVNLAHFAMVKHSLKRVQRQIFF